MRSLVIVFLDDDHASSAHAARIGASRAAVSTSANRMGVSCGRACNYDFSILTRTAAAIEAVA
jgi:hypothetical protein